MGKFVNKTDDVVKDEKVDKKSKKDLDSSYGYYSKILNKPFDTLEELMEAETQYKEEQAKKEAAALAKRNAAAVVNAAIDAYEEGKVKCDAAIEQAYNEYKDKVAEAEKELAVLERDANEKINKWLEDHPGEGFHYTYRSKNGKVTRTYSYYTKRYDPFDDYLEFKRLLSKLWKW